MAERPPSGHFNTIAVAPLPGAGLPLFLTPLRAGDAGRLGTAFAAIDPWASIPYSPAALTSYFAASEPTAPRYAIRAGETLVGALGVRMNWLRGPYIQFLGLFPVGQSQRAGSRVLGWFENEARENSQNNLWVAASDTNTGALRFYRRHGFEPVAGLDGLVSDGRTEILLRKRL